MKTCQELEIIKIRKDFKPILFELGNSIKNFATVSFTLVLLIGGLCFKKKGQDFHV